jgi:hypothetical protein
MHRELKKISMTSALYERINHGRIGHEPSSSRYYLELSNSKLISSSILLKLARTRHLREIKDRNTTFIPLSFDASKTKYVSLENIPLSGALKFFCPSTAA